MTIENNCILTIHSGAGGTESQDWGEMLLRMYLRWAEQQGIRTDIIDLWRGEEAGIKWGSIEFEGENVYDLLEDEGGIHRLVRISPFDTEHRRHTSFSTVFVYKTVDDSEIEIDAKDLRIDIYRPSGAGGQLVYANDGSAVRVIHEPTGIVVQCQDECSQHRNRDNAMKILKARLHQLGDKKDTTERRGKWGEQVRSYVFHPYKMVKDHRNDNQTDQIEEVLNGNLELIWKK